MAELEGDAPGVAEHDEHRAVGQRFLGEQCGAGGDQARAVGAGLAAEDGEVEGERRLGGVVGDRGRGVVVDLEADSAGVVAKEMGEAAGVVPAKNPKPEVRDIPGGDRTRIGDVEGEVLEVHRDDTDRVFRRLQRSGLRKGRTVSGCISGTSGLVSSSSVMGITPGRGGPEPMRASRTESRGRLVYGGTADGLDRRTIS